MESAIMDTGDCQPLYHAIRDYYEEMNMKLDQQIPMLLVERQALNEAIVGEKNVRHGMRFGFSFKVGAPFLMLVFLQGHHHMLGTRGVFARSKPCPMYDIGHLLILLLLSGNPE